MDDIGKEAQEMVNKLTVVRNEFIKNRQELAVSIRKDIVCANLKDFLNNCNTYEELTEQLQKFIDNLMSIGDDNKNESNHKQ